MNQELREKKKRTELKPPKRQTTFTQKLGQKIVNGLLTAALIATILGIFLATGGFIFLLFLGIGPLNAFIWGIILFAVGFAIITLLLWLLERSVSKRKVIRFWREQAV